VRRHRLGVAAGASAALALSLGIGVAILEGREAQHQRDQAEGMIEFMLGDLRKRLEPVGRLDVLDAVGEKALAYYAAQETGRQAPDSLGRRSRALHLMGEIAEKRGRLDEADKMFREAAESTAELLARTPGDGQRLFDHAQSVYWVGYAARRRGMLQEAEAQFKHYQQLANSLVALDPANTAWRIEQAYAGQNLGVLLLESGRPAEALTSFQATKTVWRNVVGSNQNLRFDLANTLGWLAKAHESLGEYAQALQAQRDKIEVFAPTADASGDSSVAGILANAALETGSILLTMGRGEQALQDSVEAVAALTGLLKLEPDNLEWLQQLCLARLHLADVHLALGDQARARAQLAGLGPQVEKLLRLDTRKASWQIKLRGLHLLLQLRLGESPPKHRRLIKAQNDYRQTVASYEAGGRALKPEYAKVVAENALHYGDLLAADGGEADGRVHWEAAATRLRPLAERGDHGAMALLASVQTRLGLDQEARALADKLQASAYRHPRYAALRTQIGGLDRPP
jgi:eukaryotic-like serine/threonine-protein kinase